MGPVKITVGFLVIFALVSLIAIKKLYLVNINKKYKSKKYEVRNTIVLKNPRYNNNNNNNNNNV